MNIINITKSSSEVDHILEETEMTTAIELGKIWLSAIVKIPSLTPSPEGVKMLNIPTNVAMKKEPITGNI